MGENTGLGIALGAGAGTLIDVATTDYKYKKQYQQAEKLQGLQMQGQREMGKFNQGLAIDTYMKTASPEAQTKMLKDAGLNVGLMYGTKGGGGGTTSQQGQVSGQSAEMPNIQGLGIQQGVQLAMAKAQIDNINADTTQKKVNAAKTAGVDTEKTAQEIENLKIAAQKTNAELWNIAAETANKEEQNIILQQQKQMTEIDREIKNMTKEAALNAAKAGYDKTIEELKQSQVKTKIDQATADKQIESVFNATAKQLAEILAIKEGTQFNYGSDADKVRWINAAAGALRSAVKPLD